MLDSGGAEPDIHDFSSDRSGNFDIVAHLEPTLTQNEHSGRQVLEQVLRSQRSCNAQNSHTGQSGSDVDAPDIQQDCKADGKDNSSEKLEYPGQRAARDILRNGNASPGGESREVEQKPEHDQNQKGALDVHQKLVYPGRKFGREMHEKRCPEKRQDRKRTCHAQSKAFSDFLWCPGLFLHVDSVLAATAASEEVQNQTPANERRSHEQKNISPTSQKRMKPGDECFP